MHEFATRTDVAVVDDSQPEEVSWDYTFTDPEWGPRQAKALVKQLEEELSNEGARVGEREPARGEHVGDLGVGVLQEACGGEARALRRRELRRMRLPHRDVRQRRSWGGAQLRAVQRE